MPIQGNIEEAGLPDVLQLLALGRKTGCLTLVDGTLKGEIYLDVGRVSYATVANRLDRLGDMLVKNGRITQQQLDAAIAEQQRISNRQLGRILVDSGRVERGDLERFIRLQVEEAVYFLFTWKQGTFTFTSDRLPPHQPLLVSLEAENLLLEGARRVDEWDVIQKKIPSLQLVFRRTRDKIGTAADGLTDVQKRLLPLIDGERSVIKLIDETALSEFEAGKALYGLVTAGLLQLVERRARIRHLEYRELLAYSVKEAEFADPQKRKEAARHIVDCVSCAEKLRTIHVRRTTQTAAMPDTASDEAPAADRATVPASQKVASPPSARAQRAAAAPAAAREERRMRERRAGRDRRQFDRRSGADRRAPVGGRAPAGGGQRMATRREEDRRATGYDRRAAGAVRPAAAAEASRVRLTEPRQLAPHELESPAVPAAAERVAEEATAAAASARRAAGAPARGGAPSRDIEWLVTPDESLDMMRASQIGLRASSVARPPAAPPRRPSPDPAVLQRRSPITMPTVEPGAVPPPPVVIERFAPSRAETRPAGSAVHMVPPPAKQSLPLRQIVAGLGIAGVAFLGYLAGHVGSGRAGDRATAQTPPVATATPTPAPAAAASRRESAAAPAEPRAASHEPSPRAEALATRSVDTPRPAPRQTERNRAAAAPPPRRTVNTEPQRPARAQAQAPATSRPVAVSPPTPKPEPAAPPPPTPTVGTVRGEVRDATGHGVSGAKVAIRGTNLSAVTDPTGAFEISSVPEGNATVQASANGYLAATAPVTAKAGAAVEATLTLTRPVTALEPDSELAAGGWIKVSRGEAASVLGGTLGIIPGLPIESVAQSAAGRRPRIRVAQLTPTGERIALTETRAGADVRGGPGPASVTALRVMPASEAYPWSTGTVSFGNVLITVKTHLGAGPLRTYLGKLTEAPAGS